MQNVIHSNMIKLRLGIFRLISSLYTGAVALPIMFLLQAFTIMQFSDDYTEQG